MSKRLILALLPLVAVLLFILPATAAIYDITTGNTVFIGEQNLSIGGALAGNTTIAWYASGAVPGTDSPAKVVDVTGTTTNFYVSPSVFSDYTGPWYRGVASNVVAFYVEKPSIDMKIFNDDTGKDISDKSIVRGQSMDIRVDSNLYLINNQRGGTGYLTVKVKDASGAVASLVYNNTGGASALTGLPANAGSMTTQWFISNATSPNPIWGTDYKPATSYFYKAGNYEVWVEANPNAMKDNWGSVTGVTVSKHYTVTISDEDVVIDVNTDTVVRGNDFSVTITARPDAGSSTCGTQNRRYVVWVVGTESMTATSMPPIIKDGQSGVCVGDFAAVAPIGYNFGYGGRYVYTGTLTVENDSYLNNYATVSTDGAGKRTIGFSTNAATDDKTYTIRVQDMVSADKKYDEVKVKVTKGAVTIDAEGTKSYYVGQEIKFFGENTDSEEVYLFITGPNLPSDGGVLTAPFTRPDSVNFKRELVKSDDTWEFEWATGDLPLDAGTYTIYAASENVDKGSLSDVQYDSVSIQLRKPFVNASLPASRIAKGDDVKVTGTAEGDPSAGLQFWVLGTNLVIIDTETVEDDKTFEFKLEDTESWSAGQYFVVVQHPMYNDRLDVKPDATCPSKGSTACTKVLNYVKSPTGLVEFNLAGPDRLMGSDAAQALVSILDQPNIDDTYAKLFFLLEEAWINIDAVSDKYVGDTFTLSGTTNLAVDDSFLISVTSASFRPTEKTQAGEFSGVSGSTKVVKGTGVDNVWSFEVDTTGFKPDQYIVKVECIETDSTATTTFFVSEVPPTVVTTAPPVTSVVTTAPPTATTTTVPVATTTPGFGAVIALIGLGAVAVLVLRRH